MSDKHSRVCPVERSGALDSRIRRWLQNPRKIVGPYLSEGMTVLDVGCGPGLFSIDMAEMVGESGCVIAADLQQGMLDKLKKKVRGTPLEGRIQPHLCRESTVGVEGEVDFVLAFYMVHELSDPDGFFREMAGVLKPEGRMLVVEPPLHVSKSAFERTLAQAQAAGFELEQRPNVLLSKAALFRKS